MQNLYRVFNDVVISKEAQLLNTTVTAQTGDYDLAFETSQVMAALDAEAEGEDDDKVAITFSAIRDGSVDLLLVLGFDRDIYSKNMQYRADQDDSRREGTNRREAFIS